MNQLTIPETNHNRLKLMIDKLYDQAARGCIDSLWAEEFVEDMKTKLDNGESFTTRQVAKIEDLFERY